MIDQCISFRLLFYQLINSINVYRPTVLLGGQKRSREMSSVKFVLTSLGDTLDAVGPLVVLLQIQNYLDP